MLNVLPSLNKVILLYYYYYIIIIRSVLKATVFSVLKLIKSVMLWALRHLVWLKIVLALLGHYFPSFEITKFG